MPQGRNEPRPLTALRRAARGIRHFRSDSSRSGAALLSRGSAQTAARHRIGLEVAVANLDRHAVRPHPEVKQPPRVVCNSLGLCR